MFNADRPISRRQTLRAGLAAGVALGAPAILHAQDKSGAKPPVLGEGAHRYECLHEWGELPKGTSWQTTHGVAIDEAGHLYVKHKGHGREPGDTIFVFDADGKFVRSFGPRFHGGGHGIDIRKEGAQEFAYLCDTRGSVVKMDLSGEEVWALGMPREAEVYQNGMKYRPTNVAFAPDGGFYVGDGYGSHFIHQYDQDAKWVRTWGGHGSAAGKMKTPHGLWLDRRPGRDAALVVADRANARLQYFTLDGEHLGFVHGFGYPAHFDIYKGVLLVPDLHARVTLLSADNEPIVHLGDDPAWTKEVKKFEIRKNEARWAPGRFIHPHDACYDADGNIFVAEWVETGRITKLRKLS